MKYKCVTCEGTGEVHSHNPRCWDCRGSGITDIAKAEKAIRSVVIPEIAKIKSLAKEKFGKEEQDSEVNRLLQIATCHEKYNSDNADSPSALGGK